MRYLVLTSFDERYDLNFTVKIFNGTVEEYEAEDMFVSHCQKEVADDGVIRYHDYNRRPFKEITHNTKNISLELIEYYTVILIPMHLLEDDEFHLYDSIFTRNRKFGILDVTYS